MHKILTRAVVVILVLFAIIVLLYAMTHKPPEPRAVNARGSDIQTNIGKYQVTLKVNPKQFNDEGTATIEIVVNEQVTYKIQADYDYDNWQNEHPLWYWHTDFDQDGIRDLMLRRNSDNQQFWVNGSNGKTSIIK